MKLPFPPGPAVKGKRWHVQRGTQYAGVGTQRLAGGAGGKEFNEYCQIGSGRHYLLHARHRYMDIRRHGHHADIGFTFNQNQGARVSGDEVRAADAHIGGQKLLP